MTSACPTYTNGIRLLKDTERVVLEERLTSTPLTPASILMLFVQKVDNIDMYK